MKSILVATDFSAPSKNAARYAAQLAKLAGAKLTILHAYLLPTPVSEVPYVMVSVDELQKDNEKAAGELAEELRAISGGEVVPMVTIGMPADEVVYQSKEIGADLVVAGMRGESTVLDKLVGSTTSAILRKSHIPVLVIPTGRTFEPISQITYATDYSYTMNLRCLKTLKEITRLHPETQLTVVNIQRPGEIMTAEQISGKVRLEPMLEEMKHEYQTRENINVEDGLSQFLDTNPSQMLVMVAHKHNWWERLVSGSHTGHMIHKINIPYLVLQDKD